MPFSVRYISFCLYKYGRCLFKSNLQSGAASRIVGGGGGGGRKRLCSHRHDYERGTALTFGSSRVILMLSHAILALFLSILI